MAKGGINGDHVLICPIQHHNSTVVAPDDVVMELEKYKRSLRAMFKVRQSTSSRRRMGPVGGWVP